MIEIVHTTRPRPLKRTAVAVEPWCGAASFGALVVGIGDSNCLACWIMAYGEVEGRAHFAARARVQKSAADIDSWVDLFDTDLTMSVRARGELRDLFARATKQAHAEGVRDGVKACASVARDRAEISMMPNDRSKWERNVALQIEARCRRIVAVHAADPDLSRTEPKDMKRSDGSQW